MDKAHSPKQFFNSQVKQKYCFEQKKSQVTGADPKETTG
jgi:hypothetical protein